MDDLISRQAAIELIESEYRRWGEEYEITDVLCDLGDLPTADFSEYCDKLWKTAYERGEEEARPKGKWMRTITAYPYCSVCDWMPEEDEMVHGLYNFCPNCGARME